MNHGQTYGRPHNPWLVRNAIPAQDLALLDQEGFEANGEESKTQAVFQKRFESALGPTRVETVAYNFQEKAWEGSVSDHAGRISWKPATLRQILDQIEDDRAQTVQAKATDHPHPWRPKESLTGLRAQNTEPLRLREDEALHNFIMAMTQGPWTSNAAGAVYSEEHDRTIGSVALGTPEIPTMPTPEEADANRRVVLAAPIMFKALMQAHELAKAYAQKVPLEDESRLGYTGILNTLREGLRATGFEQSLVNTKKPGDAQ